MQDSLTALLVARVIRIHSFSTCAAIAIIDRVINKINRNPLTYRKNLVLSFAPERTPSFFFWRIGWAGFSRRRWALQGAWSLTGSWSLKLDWELDWFTLTNKTLHIPSMNITTWCIALIVSETILFKPFSLLEVVVLVFNCLHRSFTVSNVNSNLLPRINHFICMMSFQLTETYGTIPIFETTALLLGLQDPRLVSLVSFLQSRFQW